MQTVISAIHWKGGAPNAGTGAENIAKALLGRMPVKREKERRIISARFRFAPQRKQGRKNNPERAFRGKPGKVKTRRISVKEMSRADPKKGAQNQPCQPRSFQGMSEKEEKFKQNQVQ